ncbi:citrate lyase subunit alpha [Erysipelotrichaceae bacterium OttesenSCG-928-M19]|nr:citrate lyase subunit alpha [Erysipelotrichaceae bacterium OttesenSCG-928-M19]
MSKTFDGIKEYQYINYEFSKNKALQLDNKLVTLEHLKENNVFFDGMTISFHHHLRNGDYVANMLFEIIEELALKDITIVASSIFPVHKPLVELIKNGNVTSIYAAYISGEVADCISAGYLKNPVYLHSHGARARLLLNKEVTIDLAFIAAPSVDKSSNINGSEGPSSCGVLGYAYADALVAKTVVAITDNIINEVNDIEISGTNVDYVIEVDSIGDANGIVSGTTQVTKDPLGLLIARNATKVIEHSGLLKDGFSFQTGAGGISLAVAMELEKIMIKNKIKGSFASGGITAYLVNMLEKNLFEKLYDVQCFDLDAVASIKRNKNHHKMSASFYANPYDRNNIVKDLDVVILGATEIDLDYNVNVTTTSNGVLMGGSGGHSDTAAGAKLTIIVSKLIAGRISVIRDQVTTITTPGESVDVLVTDYGIAINPKHQELINNLKDNTNLKIYTIEELYKKALALTGIPKQIKLSDEIVGIVEYRDGTILDYIYKVK